MPGAFKFSLDWGKIETAAERHRASPRPLGNCVHSDGLESNAGSQHVSAIALLRRSKQVLQDVGAKIFGVPPLPSFLVLSVVLGLAILVTLLGSALPLRRATRCEPAPILRGE